MNENFELELIFVIKLQIYKLIIWCLIFYTFINFWINWRIEEYLELWTSEDKFLNL